MTRDLPYRKYQCAYIDEAGEADLTRFGVRIHLPAGDWCYFPDECGELYKEIGRATVSATTGRIDLYPYRRLTELDMGKIRGFGWTAYENPPQGNDNWVLRQVSGGETLWETVLSVAEFAIDKMTARILRSSYSHHERQDQLFGQIYEGFDSAA
ncbi:hypothetical protein [Nocardia wallacei]|uniref:hypothetical protein n=1 Tax=Nocardia wallacei TaxID=480035 RepID=UPI00245886F1|nr:hypothetical protein [Nocardia wallacei]